MASVYGYVGRIVHQGDNFFVFNLDLDHAEPPVPESTITVTGHLYGLQQVKQGVAVQFVGDWKRHPKFGKQFVLYGWFPWATHDYGVQRFLNECVRGFEDTAMVETLVNAMGTLTYERLSDDPTGVLSLFPDQSQQKMQAESAILYWNESRALSNLSIFLQGYDLHEDVIRNVFAKFGTEAVNLISDNPYRLVAVDGFAFGNADALASRIGIPKTDNRRFDGAVFWILKSEAQQGHLSVRRGDFGDLLKTLVYNEQLGGFDDADAHKRLMESVARLEASGAVRVDPRTGVYLPELYLYEREGARKLAKFFTPSKIEIDLPGFLTEYEKGNNIELSPAQRDAVKKLVENRVLALTGLPGTGKTTIIRAIVRLFKLSSVSCILMAPTGIAAKRLAAVTGEPASTIHRTLGWTGTQWEFNGRNKYSIGAVIVDEMSMVDQELFYRILDALDPTTMLVLVGDDAQLPSVGPGNVLRELITCPSIPHVRLTQIFRQSQQSEIIIASHKINKGEPPQLEGRKPDDEFRFLSSQDEDKILEMIVAFAVKLKSKDANFQVLSPKYDGAVGVHALNQAIRDKLNPLNGQKEHKAGKIQFREGDRLMVVKNDYALNVSNGDMGKLVTINKEHLLVRIHGVGSNQPDTYVEIPKHSVPHMLRLAYAITVHKSQGSEFDTIIMPIVRSQGRMLQRNLFYTAVTRAKKRVFLLGDQSAVYKAVGNDKVVQRNTVFGRSVNEAVEALVSGVETGQDERREKTRKEGDPLRQPERVAEVAAVPAHVGDQPREADGVVRDRGEEPQLG
jgi:exodeoxyribonuclease V alpha subunit